MSIKITLPEPTIVIPIPDGFAKSRVKYYKDYTEKGAEKWKRAMYEYVFKHIPRTHQGIYQFYNKLDELIYVGRTTNSRNRINQHIINGAFNGEVSKIKLIYVDNVCDQEIYETYMINNLKPKYNKGKLNKEKHDERMILLRV